VALSRSLLSLALLAPLLVAAALLAAGDRAPADVPDPIRAPPGERLVLAAHASGFQIYVCTPSGDGKLQWTLKAPEAQLRDGRGTLIGRHFAGPSWRYKDGSEVTGKAVARVDAPDPQAIPWLLLSAVAHTGSGLLEQVTSIQRIHTHRGLPPPAAQCNAARRDVEVRSPYSADYFFYAPASGDR